MPMTNLIELRETGISRRQDNLQTFELLEIAAIDRAKKSSALATEAAFYINLILKHRLWRHRKNEDGNPLYEKQKYYLQELESKVGWGRASIFEYAKATKLADWLGFKTVEDVNAVGGIQVFRIAAEEIGMVGKIDSKTGEVTHYDNPHKPEKIEVKDYIRDKIIQLSPMNGDPLRPVQLREEMRVNLSGRTTYEFDLIPIPETGGWDLAWAMTTFDPATKMPDFERGTFAEGNVPHAVMAIVCKKLFIRTKNDEQGD